MKRPIALLFCLLMITMPMAGCIEGDDSSDASDKVLEDWNVHFAATAADLPTCDEDTNGRLYYVEADNQFQVCKTTGWEIIDIRGADGADGEPGKDGRDGSPGRDVDQSIIANYENQLSLQNATIASLEYNISKLQSDKDRLENDLNQVENDLNQAENDLYTAIASLQSQINSLNLNATTCQLVPYADCAGADLRGTDFTGMDLTGINFRGANLQNTTFDNATLRNAVLDNAKAWNSSFHYTNFQGASLLGTQFWGLYKIDGSCCYGVIGAEMTYADFRDSHLGYTWFTYADLTGANFDGSFSAGLIIFEYADLSEVDFGDTHFSEINVRESNLYLTDFEDAYLRLVVANDGTNWQLTTWTNGNTYNAQPSVAGNIINE